LTGCCSTVNSSCTCTTNSTVKDFLNSPPPLFIEVPEVPMHPIHLPASEKAVPEKEEARQIKGHSWILVIDDEASLRKMVERMLEKLGYKSEFAKNGAEAIRMYKDAQESEKPFDAVILDLTVPGAMGGKETVKRLLEIDPELKAIVSSSYSDDSVLANFKKYGFRGMMPKPFESLSLSGAFHEVLKGEKD
jgi:CheY-like chemotaxis protein